MRGRAIVLIASLFVLGFPAVSAHAQLRGLLGAVTAPVRHILGNLGHYPRAYRSSRAPQERQAAAGQAGEPKPGQSHLAAIGPAAWPTAFEDVLGYTFWPATYAARVRGRGFDVIADTITMAPRGAEIARVATTGTAVQNDSDGNGRQACNTGADAPIEWPISQIEQTTQLNDAQRQNLGKLKTALAESIKTAKAGCRDTTNLPPVNRLNATVQQIWAVRDAGIYVRTALKDFYDSLTDAQKASFQWKQPEDSRQGAKAAEAMGRKHYEDCAAVSLDASDRMLRQIEQDVRPTQQQSAGVEALRKTSAEMAKLVTASCGQPIPADPVARLDATADQLTTLSYAATTMDMALDGFYAQLDQAQKAKFDSMGR